jgi:hypothetical protein
MRFTGWSTISQLKSPGSLDGSQKTGLHSWRLSCRKGLAFRTKELAISPAHGISLMLIEVFSKKDVGN